MKSAKSNKSLTSFKSTKSMKTNLDSKRTDAGEFIDLTTMLPIVCAKLQCPYEISVKKQQQQDEFYKAIKYGDATSRQRKRLSILPPPAAIPSQHSDVKTSDDDKSGDTETFMATNALTITALYDTYNCLTEILLNEIKVPRVLMQVLGLLVPYFQSLTTLTVRQCCIDFYTIHEISKILELSTITSVSLDNSPVLERSYEILLNEKSTLRSLSLCKCKLSDDDCKKLVAKLHHGAPAENLQILDLSSNHITDVGAKYISDALRSNRRLRYLSVADNRITDEGAFHLFGVLIEFPLTADEIVNMRERYMKYLKYKQALYSKYLNECDRSTDDISQSGKKSAKRRKSARRVKDPFRRYSDEDARERAEMLANEILGQFIDPFDSNSLKYHDNYYYCLGNMVLCYLNISYNNLSFLTIKKLLDVMNYQNVTKKVNQYGLVKVVIDGNNLPMCKELVLVNELFSRNIKNIAGKTDAKRRRSRII